MYAPGSVFIFRSQLRRSPASVIPDEPLSCANRNSDIGPGEILALSKKLPDTTSYGTWWLPRIALSDVGNYVRLNFIVLYYPQDCYRHRVKRVTSSTVTCECTQEAKAVKPLTFNRRPLCHKLLTSFDSLSSSVGYFTKLSIVN
jgi:hypothetical protein